MSHKRGSLYVVEVLWCPIFYGWLVFGFEHRVTSSGLFQDDDGGYRFTNLSSHHGASPLAYNSNVQRKILTLRYCRMINKLTYPKCTYRGGNPFGTGFKVSRPMSLRAQL